MLTSSEMLFVALIYVKKAPHSKVSNLRTGITQNEIQWLVTKCSVYYDNKLDANDDVTYRALM